MSFDSDLLKKIIKIYFLEANKWICVI